MGHDPDDRFTHIYDDENRVASVHYDEDYGDGVGDKVVRASYRYDALGRRIEYIDHTNSVTTRYVYDGDNIVAEIDETGTAQRSYVNGPQYIDERIVMCDEITGYNYYYLLQELYTVAGLVEANGALAEAAVYDAYGHATLYDWPPYDSDRDTDVDVTDYGAFLTCYNGPGNPPGAAGCEWADTDYDGDVDLTEYGEFLNVYGAANEDKTVEMTYSALGNPFWFTGRLTDTLAADGPFFSGSCPPDGAGCDTDTDGLFRRLQDNRNRTYDPKHGRWLQRDPLGVQPGGRFSPTKQYGDGAHLYVYVQTRPTIITDPAGLKRWMIEPTGGVSDKFGDFGASLPLSDSDHLTEWWLRHPTLNDYDLKRGYDEVYDYVIEAKMDEVWANKKGETTDEVGGHLEASIRYNMYQGKFYQGSLVGLFLPFSYHYDAGMIVKSWRYQCDRKTGAWKQLEPPTATPSPKAQDQFVYASVDVDIDEDYSEMDRFKRSKLIVTYKAVVGASANVTDTTGTSLEGEKYGIGGKYTSGHAVTIEGGFKVPYSTEKIYYCSCRDN